MLGRGITTLVVLLAAVLAAPPAGATLAGRVAIPAGGPAAQDSATMTMLPFSDGSIVVAGTTNTAVAEVAKLTPAGVLDPAFGSGGIELPGVALTPERILPGPQGDILIAASATDTSAQAGDLFPPWRLLRLLGNGTPDPSFGSGGSAVLAGTQADGGDALIEPDGSILLATRLAGTSTPPRAAVAHVLPDGTLDPAFGTGGIAVLPHGDRTDRLALLPDGSALAVAGSPGTRGAYTLRMIRLSATGSPNAVSAPISLPLGAEPLLAQPDGGELISLPTGGGTVVERFTPAGLPDRTWGAHGQLTLPPAVWRFELLPEPDGSMLFVSPAERPYPARSPGYPAWDLRVVHITGRGTADPRFGGTRGRVVGVPLGGADWAAGGGLALLPSNTFAARVASFALAPDGSLVAGGLVELGAYTGEGVATWEQQFGVARLTPSLRPDPTFGAAPGLSIRIAALARERTGLRVQVTCTQASAVVVRAVAAGRLVAGDTVPCWSPGTVTATLPLTAAGRRLAHAMRGLTLAARGEDMRGSLASASARAAVRW